MKQIKAKIKSVSNIRKMTRALEVVSTIKLQKVKKQTEQYRDFLTEFLKIAQVIHTKVNLFDTDTEAKKNGRTLLLVLSTEKGLCGAVNSRLLRSLYADYQDTKDTVDVFTVGKKATEFFARTGFNIVGTTNLKDSFEANDLSVLHAFLRDEFAKGSYDSIKLCFNYFENPISQIPVQLQLLPFDRAGIEDFMQQVGNLDLSTYLTDDIENKDLMLEPTQEVLKKEFMNQFFEHLVYGAVLQNKTGEYAARMIAMKNAKDNAGGLIDKLTLQYNKARQSVITQEISEIVSAKIALETA